jgi:hypothetical protein
MSISVAMGSHRFVYELRLFSRPAIQALDFGASPMASSPPGDRRSLPAVIDSGSFLAEPPRNRSFILGCGARTPPARVPACLLDRAASRADVS